MKFSMLILLGATSLMAEIIDGNR